MDIAVDEDTGGIVTIVALQPIDRKISFIYVIFGGFAITSLKDWRSRK